ncbi:MAG: molecular chaperone TorD family protein [Coriobacteriales bacterium]|jgi:TorA maturation chaperone TorD|nr:molecular chaperone TorD family protein [Coriobacteriales bacterium]
MTTDHFTNASSSPASAHPNAGAPRALSTNISDDGALIELAQLNVQRAATYAFLSRLYRVEIDAELLEELREMRFPVDTGDEKIDRGYRTIAVYLSAVWENSLTELAVDYARVFIGHGVDAFSAAYPFESVYTSEKRLLMQDARDEVLALYRASGLHKSSRWKEGEDHIALELEFMQALCQRTADALKNGDEKTATRHLLSQLNFLIDHLAAWAPMMTADMKSFAQTGLYQGLAWLTEGFLETEVEFLKDLLVSHEAIEQGDRSRQNGRSDHG